MIKMNLTKLNLDNNTEEISVIDNGKVIHVINFPPTVKGRPITKTVLLRNNIGHKITIHEITFDNAKITTDSEIKELISNTPIILKYTPGPEDKLGVKNVNFKIIASWLG